MQRRVQSRIGLSRETFSPYTFNQVVNRMTTFRTDIFYFPYIKTNITRLANTSNSDRTIFNFFLYFLIFFQDENFALEMI